MPLKLIPPRQGRSPHYRVRGTHLGQYVDRSTQTGDERLARRILRQWRDDIECGRLSRPDAPNFASAATSYMMAGGERRFLVPLLLHFRLTPLDAIDQAAIDNAAATLLPAGSAATRNRQIYTPVSAVLRHAGHRILLRRPKGWDAKRHTSWLQPQQAFRLFAAADALDAEFGLFLRFLCYTGCRLSEALRLTKAAVNLREKTAHIHRTKTGRERVAHLPPILVKALRQHIAKADPNAPLFRFRKDGRLYRLWRDAKKAAGISLPARQGGFHLWCHTWASWMKHYAGLEDRELTATNRWADLDSVARYGHLKPGAAARAADRLPVERRKTRPA